jgi:hypothetical protein
MLFRSSAEVGSAVQIEDSANIFPRSRVNGKNMITQNGFGFNYASFYQFLSGKWLGSLVAMNTGFYFSKESSVITFPKPDDFHDPI